MPDSDLYIEYLKSGISVSTDSGCNIGCKYCIVSEFSHGQSLIRLSPEYVADEIYKYPLYNEHTPIIINNRTDPFLIAAKDNTFRLIEILDERKVPNPRIIISKLLVGENYIQSLSNLKYPTFLFRTFSGMPQSIEPTSTIKHLERACEENTRLKECKNLHTVHYWRPIIPNINSDPELLKQILSYVSVGFDCSVVSGIRVTPNLYNVLTNFGADLSSWNGDTNHKYLDSNTYSAILKIRDMHAPGYQIFRNTSCAISTLMGLPDFNLNFYKGRFCQNCPNKRVCETHVPRQPCKDFDTIEYMLDGNRMKIKTPISQEQISCIKHRFGYLVEADKVLKQKSELLLEKTYSG